MSDVFSLLKIIHISTVVFTGSYFFIRGLALINHQQWYKEIRARKVSRYNDTTLLLSGMGMAALMEQYPFIDAWLTAKILLIVIYIILGMLALYWLQSWKQKILAGLAALLVYGYIVGIALSKNPVWIQAVYKN